MTMSASPHPLSLKYAQKTRVCRYSETQLAPNGLRYREWLTVFASPQSIEKARLDAHVLDVTAYHQALHPWKRDSTGQVESILVRSSLPLEQRVLHDRTPLDAGVSRYACFVRSCKARLTQDLKSLPVREDSPAQTIQTSRTNATFYEDERANQILLVYAPDGSKQLEFVCMTLMDK